MASQPNTTVCGLPSWAALPDNDTTSYINDALAAGINLPISLFTSLSNLAIIVIVTIRQQLQRPSNIFLCSLAVTDCLTSLTSQPLFFIWRLMLHRARQSCDFQMELFHVRYVFNTLTTGWSFVILMLISFDRAYALTKPLIYRATITNGVAITAASITLVTWLLLTISIHFLVPGILQYILQLASAVLFILVPIINHIRMFLSIRRYNRQVTDAVNQEQLLTVFRREKKVALDMFLVTMALLACLGPMLVLKLIFQYSFPKLYDIFYPWAFAVMYYNSLINPILYVSRNKQIRNALKAVIPFC